MGWGGSVSTSPWCRTALEGFLHCEPKKMPTMHKLPTCCTLQPDAIPHWHAAAAGLPASALDAHLAFAAHLARVMADVERLEAKRRSTDGPRRVTLLLRELSREVNALLRRQRERLAEIRPEPEPVDQEGR